MLRTSALAAVVALCAVPAGAHAATPRRHPIPPIREGFTALPCTGSPAHRTTLQSEGCLERLVIDRDRQIDTAADALYARLPAAGRRELVSGARAWLAYRDDDCRALAATVGDGTEAGIVDLQCLARADEDRLGELRSLQRDAFPTASSR